MAKPDPTKDPKFQQVVRTFLTTPPAHRASRSTGGGPLPRKLRVSCERGDAAYRPAPWFADDGTCPEIYLNGERQQLVMTADSELGIVRRIKLVAGKPVQSGGEFVIEEVLGRVEILFV